MQADVGVRPAHYLIAEEILHQELGRTSSDWRNWRVGLADLATKFIDLSSDLPHRSRGITSDILRAVLIERGSAQSPAGPWDTEFSPLLEDVPNVDGRRRVLDHLTDTFPEEPHFWAHLGRFYSGVDRDHEKAHTAHQTALGLLPNDPLLHHMAGMGWRAELYGMLDSVNSDFGREYEAKIFEIVGEASKEFGSSPTPFYLLCTMVGLHVPDCECYSETSHCNRNGATASRKEDLLSGGWRFKEERFWRDP